MEYEVILSDSSREDLKSIIDYIERVSFSKTTAERFAAEIISWTFILQIFPYMYPKVYKDFRSFTVKNRRIFYIILEDKKEILIYRILWSLQRYEDYL